ncbi:hypothetical protein INR49_030779 [Caranx melampygus]|nr:hypothetical protein INR49_030779 [Caranx melampygus]
MINSEKQKHHSDEEVIKELCLVNGVSYENIAQEGSNISSLEIFFSGFPRMVGLSLFPRLCQLTIVDQDIRHIEGLECCPLLQELWVIQCQLTSLNLSGNKISSFKELTLLARLAHLTTLSLKDPTSTPNPVCLLCNYATHVLYHMPGLQRLDTYDVSCKHVKEASESTVMKKIMYYNMRVRTAQRNLAETRFRLIERKKTLLRLPEESIRTLSHALKKLECELSKVMAGCKKSACTVEEEPGEQIYLPEGSSDRYDATTDINHDPNMESKILVKMDVLRERLGTWTRRLDEIKACYEQDLAQATNMMEHTVQFLLMELESVGNIRLEEGCSTDPWYTSCCDLLNSCFSQSDYKTYGITGIKINRVIRIYNSALRLRFEDKLHRLLASDDNSQNYRRLLEHLFYAADPEKNSEREDIFCILEEGFKTTEQYKALGRDGAIPLSNSLSVTEQPRLEHRLRRAGQCDSMDTVVFRHGHIIVSKVFIGHSKPIRDGEPVNRSSHHGVCSVYRNVDTKCRTAMTEERPRSSKTNTGPECSPRRRQWFVFDHELVLPEYIIYFEYITRNQEQPASPGCSTDKHEALSNDIILDKEVLSMEPVPKALPKLLGLDDKILLNVARANVLSQITVLNLHGNSLSKIKEISHLTALRRLTISFNVFTRLDDISHMPNLEFLDASFNHLVTLEGLRGLGQLKELDVSWNKLTRAREDTAVLRKHTPTLLKLDTRYNPWNKPEAFRMAILGRLTTLTHLNGVMVTEEEAADAVHMAAVSKINQASVLAQSRTDSDRPRSLSLLSTAQLLCHLNPAPWGLSQELEPDWTAKITALNLDSQRISKLIHLNKLVNLRWASFNDNDISKVEGLDSCLKLEELSLNNNSISTLSGLSNLHCLNKLSLDGNQLSCLDASALTNLIILDLYANPLVERLENYRIYVVFHLPSLKALDGIAVEVSECENAKDMFGERLTPDMVAEKLGHSNYTDITYLTLQSCSIRMVDLSPADLFSSLRSVNLDHNNLTCFSGLIYLPNIKALCLNYNHIESILPRPKTQAHLTNRQILYNKVHSSGYGQHTSSKGNRETGPTGSLEPLMGSLEVLHLSHNGISNMANLQLSRLTNLKALFLQGNEISQVEGLEGLHQLRELVLDRNRIKALAENSFIAQKVLLELHLAENRIRELNHLSPMTELRKLFLGMNKLQDVSELDKLEVLPSLTELSVVGNPVARNSLHRPAVVLRLSRLQVLDGVMVTLEERTRAELLSGDPSPCSQCSEASLPATEINLPGLLPLVPRNAPLRAMNISGGLQTFMHGHDILSSSMDDAQSHYTYKHKKHKNSNVARSSQTDIPLRHIRRTGNNLPTTGLLSDGNRVIIAYHGQEQDSRFPSGGKPPTM